ncbi:hypothetical protein H4R34_000038 [Dimargaris verticillata]|uniref:alpha-1,2-Mannosidase n=1 Tax=Dimargaris verticillata TaxID=2761393 RepID=A0A9W8B6Z9_9FUNG|nr:hypothetical protein H4R34_000038 [Dimargaris verticillata]
MKHLVIFGAVLVGGYSFLATATTLHAFPASAGWMNQTERLVLRETVREMFNHAYNSYMDHGFPADEIRPLTCQPLYRDRLNPNHVGLNDVLGDYALTLVDSLDTLYVLGHRREFIQAIQLVRQHVHFDVDSRVQVFEVTIRMLGGLLSGHILASGGPFGAPVESYGDELLALAWDLGTRLLPAFEQSPTKFPLARVNLRRGVAVGETYDTCTAGVGTLLLEFGTLSRLTGDLRFERVARDALDAVWAMRSSRDLVGNAINLAQNQWIDATSGIGAGIDSYFEYLLKSYVLLGEPRYLDMFNQAYTGLLRYARDATGYIYHNVDAWQGKLQNSWIDSLSAFFSGLQVLAGDVESAIRSHLVHYNIWRKYHALPERFNTYYQVPVLMYYPLRPEFIESTYFLYQATRDPFYLRVGEQIIHDLNTYMRSSCGFTSLSNVVTKAQDDRMESFFLGESIKYLYLLFDEENPLNSLDTNFVFTTEAHIMHLPRTKVSRNQTFGFQARSYAQYTCPNPRAERMDYTDPDSPLSLPITVPFRPDFDAVRQRMGRVDDRFAPDSMSTTTANTTTPTLAKPIGTAADQPSIPPLTIEPLAPLGMCMYFSSYAIPTHPRYRTSHLARA